MFFLINSYKILAFSFNLNHLKKIISFHNLEGCIVTDTTLDFNRDFSIYRYPKIYEKLFNLKTTKTYKEFAEECGVNIFQLIYALKYNPLPIFIPCHLIVGKNSIGGYSPNSIEFKQFLIKNKVRINNSKELKELIALLEHKTKSD